MYGIRLVQVHVNCCGDNPFQLTPDRVRPYVSANTVMIYASAPCYPQGVVDDIAGLGDLALRYNVGLHVDACLGGFVLPFYRDGVQFDFAASKGVTSISIDTHKYGMAAKGTSVVLYRHAELRHEQYFSYADWTGGLYATPTLAGSRPGGLSVAAWASLVSLGRDGLQDACDQIREAVEAMVQGIDSIDGIKVLGKKQYMVVCFCVDDERDKDAAQLLDIYSIKDHMSEAFGWNLNDLQNPACVHLCVTLSVAPRATTAESGADPNGRSDSKERHGSHLWYCSICSGGISGIFAQMLH
jgi:glutamate/tyrosine decarboxylase-like PLP-dependent enzyme